MEPPQTDPATPQPQPIPPVSSPATGESNPPLVYPEMGAINQPSTGDAPTGDGNNSRGWLKTILFGILNWLVIPVIIVLILHNFVFQAFHVIGSSMSPTLHDTDYLIISKIGATGTEISKAFGKDNPYIPKRGEVIVFHYPKDPSLVFIKRVIGLPGERVTVKNGVVTVYNHDHPSGFNPDKDTNRTQNPTLGSVDEVVPSGNVFVLGDNRTPNGSYDSREWGSLPDSYIIGDALLRLLPVGQAGVLSTK